jgi:hypothetical protein
LFLVARAETMRRTHLDDQIRAIPRSNRVAAMRDAHVLDRIDRISCVGRIAQAASSPP